MNRAVIFAIILFSILLFSGFTVSLNPQEPGLHYDNGELVGWELNDAEVNYMVERLRENLKGGS